MTPDVPVREVMERTRTNLDAIDNDARQGRNVFEVTQLANSFLGAFAHPWEEWKCELNKVSLAEAHERGWPIIDEDDQRDRKPVNLGDLLRVIRNAVAHGNLRFIGEPGKEIEAVFLWNEDCGWRTWGATLSVATLRMLLNCIEVEARSLPDRLPREPSRHIVDRPERVRCAHCGQVKRQPRTTTVANAVVQTFD
jgi:hypothetical protein